MKKAIVVEEFNFRQWREKKEESWRRSPLNLPINLAEFRSYKDIVSEKILKILVLGRYRKGSLAGTNFELNKHHFRKIIERRVIQREPIQLVICAFPFKIPNDFLTERRKPDLGEVASITRFYEIIFRIKEIYPPGAQFIILCDGLSYGRMFGVPEKEIKEYKKGLQTVITLMGLEPFIILKDLFDLIKNNKEFSIELIKNKKFVENWWQNKKNNKEKAERIRKALRALKIRDLNLTPQEFQKYYENFVKGEKPLPLVIEEKAVRLAKDYFAFSLTKDKLKIVEKAYPDCLRMTVHPKPKQFGLFMIDKKEKLRPWYGIGLWRTDGSVRVTPEFYLKNSPEYTPVFLKNEKFPFCYLEQDILFFKTFSRFWKSHGSLAVKPKTFNRPFCLV